MGEASRHLHTLVICVTEVVKQTSVAMGRMKGGKTLN